MATRLSPSTEDLVRESQEHLSRLQRGLDESRSQVQLAMNLIDEALRCLWQIEEAQSADMKRRE
jgi:hypothetical protein